jgi:hypothetical protein
MRGMISAAMFRGTIGYQELGIRAMSSSSAAFELFEKTTAVVTSGLVVATLAGCWLFFCTDRKKLGKRLIGSPGSWAMTGVGCAIIVSHFLVADVPLREKVDMIIINLCLAAAIVSLFQRRRATA